MSTTRQPWDGFVPDVMPSLIPEELEQFAHKRILITGAGGFIGSALARHLAHLGLERLIFLDIAEHGLYRLEQDLQGTQSASNAVYKIGSVCDASLLQELFAEYEPHMIFHAAALKHVPLLETNALAAAETNVLGTQIIVDTALQFRAERVVFLSTDKAVEPISVMGATKRLAELVIFAARERCERSSMCAVLRLCNVLGSTGSVAPLFARQIARGGPLTITDPEATRFFISIDDAARCLLYAALSPAETGLSIPIVGPARRIADLAEYLRQRSLLVTDELDVVYTGLRTADKLHEQFIAPTESLRTSKVDRYCLAVNSASLPVAKVDAILEELRAAVRHRSLDLVMKLIQRAVPEYTESRKLATSPGEMHL